MNKRMDDELGPVLRRVALDVALVDDPKVGDLFRVTQVGGPDDPYRVTLVREPVSVTRGDAAGAETPTGPAPTPEAKDGATEAAGSD